MHFRPITPQEKAAIANRWPVANLRLECWVGLADIIYMVCQTHQTDWKLVDGNVLEGARWLSPEYKRPEELTALFEMWLKVENYAGLTLCEFLNKCRP